MSGRRRRNNDEFDDEPPWLPDDQADAYQPPPAAPGGQPPWEQAPRYQAQDRRGGGESRHGRHSGAPEPLSAPTDRWPASRAADPLASRPVTDGRDQGRGGRRAAGPPVDLPRQPGPPAGQDGWADQSDPEGDRYALRRAPEPPDRDRAPRDRRGTSRLQRSAPGPLQAPGNRRAAGPGPLAGQDPYPAAPGDRAAGLTGRREAGSRSRRREPAPPYDDGRAQRPDYPDGHADPRREQPGRRPADPGRADPGRPDPSRPDPSRPDPGRPDPGRPAPARLDAGRPGPADPYRDPRGEYADPRRGQPGQEPPRRDQPGRRSGPSPSPRPEAADPYAGPRRERQPGPDPGDRARSTGGFLPGLDDDGPPRPPGRTGRGRRPAEPGGRGPGDGPPRRDALGNVEYYEEPDGRRSGGGGGGKPPKRRGRLAGGSAALIVLLIIVVPLAVGGFFAYRAIESHYNPPNYSGAGTGTVVFQVMSGDNADTIGPRLVSAGIVASSRGFVLAAEASTNTSVLEPGFYKMHKHMSAALAWNLLLSPAARVQLTVTIPEGLRVSQIVAALAKGSGIPASDFNSALKDTAALHLPSYADNNPEGYLYPATYQIQPHATAVQVLQQMVTAYNSEAASINLTTAAKQVHLTPAQVIVVASLAQAEAGSDAQFPKIAEVIYNRIAAGMELDFDSTVMFALNTYGIAANDQQLEVNSPYNTYKHTGLPPGPIDSPGNAAIQAALHPDHGNWLYFVTVNPKTGQTDFTNSPTVFAQLKNELEQNLAHGG